MNPIYRLVRLNSLIQNHRFKYAAAGVASFLNVRHLAVRIDPVSVCNLSCRMCCFSNDEYRKDIKGAFSVSELERLGEMFFPLALQLVFGCIAEPTLYKDLASLVKMGKRKHVPFVGVVSNGQRLTEEKLRELMECGLDELVLSTHGVRKETYERLMTGASFDQFTNLLDILDRLQSSSRSSKLSLRINYTACPDNLEELADFFAVFGKHRIDTLQVRPYIKNGGAYRNSGMEPHLHRYNNTIELLRNGCRQRGITGLFNRMDPTYKSDGYSAVILDAVRRDISPTVVWRPDFDWRQETYHDFCRRIGWSSHLVRLALASRDDIVRSSQFAASALRYDVK